MLAQAKGEKHQSRNMHTSAALFSSGSLEQEAKGTAQYSSTLISHEHVSIPA